MTQADAKLIMLKSITRTFLFGYQFYEGRKKVDLFNYPQFEHMHFLKSSCFDIILLKAVYLETV